MWEYFVWNYHKIQIFFAYNYYYEDTIHDWVMENELVFLFICNRLPKSTLVYPVIITLPATGKDRSKIPEVCCIVCNVCNNYCLFFEIYSFNYGKGNLSNLLSLLSSLSSAKTSLLYNVNLIIYTLKKLKDILFT